jgi:protein-L-isoaspartate(D-aspartate) O-methyltransferase
MNRFLSMDISKKRILPGPFTLWPLLTVTIAFCLVLNVRSSWATSRAETAYGSVGAALTLGPPPRDSEEAFVRFMKEKRQEVEKFLKLRYMRLQRLLKKNDLYRPKEINAFMLTPREEFCRKPNRNRSYEHAALIIGYGVTLSGPHLVSRMTSAIDVKPGEKVLEIGTGSGYQSAVLANLTDKVYTVEIIEPLAMETDKIYKHLASLGYLEYNNITRKADDGYYGWEAYAPFDKIIVTCGIDHIPPPLLKQLKVGGTMCIPVGPPSFQVILKVTKKIDDQGNFIISREDIYKGQRKVAFVPFTKKGGGTHNK